MPARARREEDLRRRLAEEEDHRSEVGKRSQRIRRMAPRPRQLLPLVVPAFAVVFVAGVAWVQYRDGGGLFGSDAEGPNRPVNYQPVDKAAAADPLGQPPPIPQPAGAFQFSLTQEVGTGAVAGLGGGTAASDLDGRLAYVSGALVLGVEDITAILAQPDGTVLAQAVVQHELGHALGLDHVADRTQLMHTEGGEARDWGTGDLAGLHRLGSGACLHDL